MLHALYPAPGSRRKRKRVARGDSAGGGSTAGRGTKGQQARTGKGHRFGFEGGQIPLIRRQPKLGGFTPPRRRVYEIVKLSALEAALPAGSYDASALRAHRLVRSRSPVKILSDGTPTKKFELSVQRASKSAKAAIVKAGGMIKIVKLLNC